MRAFGTKAPRVRLATYGPIVPKRKKKLGARPDVHIRGMYGIGDCIFQRAILRDLMLKSDIRLDSYYSDMFDDLAGPKFELSVIKDRGRIRDSKNRSEQEGVAPQPPRWLVDPIKLTYSKESIHEHGSILAAMYASAGLTMPAEPDFSLPVKAEWRSQAQALLRGLNKAGKPLLVYRPIVLNSTWSAPARAPDPVAYDAIYKSIRSKFFVVSIADLNEKGGRTEWIVGAPPDVDLKLHRGELDFVTMVGLFAEASMIYANPGFVPVLAQAVGTPVVIVYGGNESFRTTNSVGKHLAPTCAIDIDTPCECHSQHHKCDKTISVEPARKKVMSFTNEILTRPKVLIFGTTYVDTPERAELTKLWCELHTKLNPDCDLLLVDSASPLFPKELPKRVFVYSFPDNIGHLSRNGPKGPNSSGRDGWGRAFCKGLVMALGKEHDAPEGLKRGYDYVVHIEGDSLFKKPVLPIVKQMREQGTKVLTVPVRGTKSLEHQWVETGLMFFESEFVRKSDFVKRYNWADRKPSPTPERVIYNMLGTPDDIFKLEKWPALRGDKQQITVDNVSELDWVSHCKGNIVYQKFVTDVLRAFSIVSAELKLGEASGGGGGGSGTKLYIGPDSTAAGGLVAGSLIKINLGCGTNKLEGWKNYDREIDITKKLPFPDNHADFIFAEHCVEHIDYYKAITFFKQCLRVLKPGGVLRITTPSLEKIMNEGVPEYFDFLADRKWAPSRDRRGAMHAILYCHGHQTAWTESLLMATFYYCGFDKIISCEPHDSNHKELVNVEGHHKVIGEQFNWIESISIEGCKS